MSNPYSTDKAFYNPKIVDAIIKKETHNLNPFFLQIMPQNKCNNDCVFCSYRISNWKNSEVFDKTAALEWPIFLGLLTDAHEMGAKAIEITGGGEPLAYKECELMFKVIRDFGFELSLVSNGSLMTEGLADLMFQAKFKWARISIDSGNPEMYARVRRTIEGHWHKAWDALSMLVERKSEPDHVIGAGFVVTDENFDGVYDFCSLAKERKVDNVRISMAFTPKGKNLINADQLELVQEMIKSTKRDFENESFHIPDTFKEKIENIYNTPVQDYDYCHSKDLLCVIEGTGKVYTCCTHTGSSNGIMGNIYDMPFKDIWIQNAEWRKAYNVKENCKCVCLYEQRNKKMIAFSEVPQHLNFI